MQLNLFSYCAQCGTEHATKESIAQTIYRGLYSDTYNFCSQSCQQHFAQREMRRLEGNHEETRAGILSDIMRRLG